VRNESEGPDREPAARPVAQTGRPPVPPRVTSDAPEDGQPDRAGQSTGEHRTEQVPSPLPPFPSAGAPAAPAGAPPPALGPVTGRLRLDAYPPRVPGGNPGRGAEADAAAPGSRPERPDDQPGADPDRRGTHRG
jgi:hypothetical protein